MVILLNIWITLTSAKPAVDGVTMATNTEGTTQEKYSGTHSTTVNHVVRSSSPNKDQTTPGSTLTDLQITQTVAVSRTTTSHNVDEISNHPDETKSTTSSRPGTAPGTETTGTLEMSITAKTLTTQSTTKLFQAFSDTKQTDETNLIEASTSIEPISFASQSVEMSRHFQTTTVSSELPSVDISSAFPTTSIPSKEGTADQMTASVTGLYGDVTMLTSERHSSVSGSDLTDVTQQHEEATINGHTVQAGKYDV